MNTRFLQLMLIINALILLNFSAFAQNVVRPEPEIGTGIKATNKAVSQNYMVVSAHPLATQAGQDVLAAGGTAADAVVAVQMMLGLVEPQSSGIGGGAFALYYNAKTKELTTLDGRESAPMEAGKHLFTGMDGQPMDFMDAVVGGRAVGVPGTLRLLEQLHEWYGTQPWGGLFNPAIRAARDGFRVTPRLSQMVAADKKYLKTYTDTALYFYPDTISGVRAGHILQNPDYAKTMHKIASEGVDAFYEGEIATEIVHAVRKVAKDNAGLLSLEDLSAYEVKERKPVCGVYRGYTVCSMGQPSSGGLTLLSILGMVEPYDLASLGKDNPQSWHLIGEASRLAFADRNYYMADPDFVKTPDELLIDRDYLFTRAKMINPNSPMDKAEYGIPKGWTDFEPLGPDVYIRRPGTSHISIVDTYGNVLSMTTTIEGAFGSKVMSGGFLLNNELTDFSFVPEKGGKPVANRVEGGKRPRSSMAPTIVFDPNGEPFMALGSAGGSRIIGFVAQRIIAAIDWDMEIQGALNMPNIVNRGEAMEVEVGAEVLARGLEKMGHSVKIDDMTSGLTAIQFKDGQIHGAADPRREGVAKGE